MPRVTGVDHLVLSVSDFARSKKYYGTLLGYLGFRLMHDDGEFAGWRNGVTRLWIAQADSEGRKRRHRKGDVGFHHYAFNLESRRAVDALGAFLEEHGMPVADPPGAYNGDPNYYAVFFTDPDGMRLEAMKYGPPPRPSARGKATRTSAARRKTKTKMPAKKK